MVSPDDFSLSHHKFPQGSKTVFSQLYGDKDFSDDVNKTILEFAIKFINETGRFD